jgi:hypothetical protein
VVVVVVVGATVVVVVVVLVLVEVVVVVLVDDVVVVVVLLKLTSGSKLEHVQPAPAVITVVVPTAFAADIEPVTAHIVATNKLVPTKFTVCVLLSTPDL